MKKNDKYALVVNAEKEVKQELTPDIYSIIGVDTRLLKIQEKLPTRPMYGIPLIRSILHNKNSSNIKHRIVINAEKEVINALTKDIYLLLPPDQKLIKVQDKLPKIPMYGTAQIRYIVMNRNGE